MSKFLCEMNGTTWRRRIVSQLSCQTRQQVFRGLSKQSQVESEKRGLNHRITAKRFSGVPGMFDSLGMKVP